MSNVRKLAAGTIVVLMLGFFFYGVARFPDAPIHSCQAHGYCGKQGQPHTYADFKAFEFWQTTCFSIWPVGLIALFLLTKRKSA